MVREEANEENILPASRRNLGFLPWLRMDPGMHSIVDLCMNNGHELIYSALCSENTIHETIDNVCV